jgi:hypothetical protein
MEEICAMGAVRFLERRNHKYRSEKKKTGRAGVSSHAENPASH